jgi:biotin carboxylase
MPRLLLLLPTTTYRAEAFLDAVRKLKVDLVVGSTRAAMLENPGDAVFLPLNMHDVEETVRSVVEFARTTPIDVVVGVDDHTTVLAAEISAALGLPHNPVTAVAAARNKHRMREILHAHGVPVPRFALFSVDDDPEELVAPSLTPLPGGERVRVRGEIGFPCVVKPISLSASCGVIRANDGGEFAAAFHRVAALLEKLGRETLGEGAGKILVEDFVPGREVALEGLLTNGELRVLALFDKPDALDGPFFEETIYVTPSRLPAAVQREVVSCAARAARALGLGEGPVHGELRANDRGVWVIEIAARSIGGRCSQALRFAAGRSLEELILRHALRMDIPSLDRESRAAGVMMVPIPRAGILEEVRGREEALAVPGIEDLEITAQPGDELVPLPEGTRYLGFLIAREESPEAVETALRNAHCRLEFIISPTPAETQRSRAMSF